MQVFENQANGISTTTQQKRYKKKKVLTTSLIWLLYHLHPWQLEASTSQSVAGPIQKIRPKLGYALDTPAEGWD